MTAATGADEFTVVAWDAPGFGRSSDPAEAFRLPDFADCLAAFVDSLGLSAPTCWDCRSAEGSRWSPYPGKPALPRTLVLASAYAGWAGSLPPQVVAERLESCLREAELPPDASRPRLCSSKGTPASALLCS